MSPKRFFFGMVGVFVICLGLTIGAAAGGNSLLGKQAKKLTQLKIEAKAMEEQQVLLAQAKKDIEKYNELDQTARTVVPQDKDQAKTVREITLIAAANKIPIKSIDFQASTLGDTPPKTAPTDGDSPSSTPKVVTPSISQVKPVEGIPGVFTHEIRVTSGGEVPYKNLIGFLEGLENNRRTAHVSIINLDPSDDGRGIKFTLTLSAYIKP